VEDGRLQKITAFSYVSTAAPRPAHIQTKTVAPQSKPAPLRPLHLHRLPVDLARQQAKEPSY
jgi:hypothetical protein